MGRQLLQQCKECQMWTLKINCPHCGGKANAAAPLKWSPEDRRAITRRKMYDVESSKWLEKLPIIDKIEDIRRKYEEE